MNRKTIPFFLITAYCLFLTSSTLAADHVSRLQETYQNTESFQAHFVQETYITILDRNEKREGKLSISAGKFRIDYLKPKTQAYIFNGKTLWIYTPKFKEVELYENAAERISQEALTFLGGLGKLREIFRIPSVKRKGSTITFTLIPKDSSSHLKKIALIVDKKDYQVREATLWPKEGNRSHYTFSNLQTDPVLTDKVFTFKVPRGVKVRRPDA